VKNVGTKSTFTPFFIWWQGILQFELTETYSQCVFCCNKFGQLIFLNCLQPNRNAWEFKRIPGIVENYLEPNTT